MNVCKDSSWGWELFIQYLSQEHHKHKKKTSKADIKNLNGSLSFLFLKQQHKMTFKGSKTATI